jgi:hypothetical protein
VEAVVENYIRGVEPMKLPNLEVRKSTESQNLEEKADDIIQEAYSAVEEAIEDELDLLMEHPAPSAVYIYADDAGITLHHGDGPTSFRVEGKEVDRHEFITKTCEELRQRFTKAIGIYAAVDDAQNS